MRDSQPLPPLPLRPNLRAQWMLAEGVAFLNHGSFGALPRAVFEAQEKWRRRIESEPVEILARRNQDLIAAAKLPLGNWLHMREDDFGFVGNATEGINAVLRSLTLRPGDELLTTTHVYNAVRVSMQYTATRAGADYREIELPTPWRSSADIVAAVLSALRPQTRLLVVDHVTSATALVLPVREIAIACAHRGVPVLVDGAHAPGMIPDLDIPALGADWYTGNLHKWSCCPKGAAFLWVRSDRRDGVHPAAISHHHHEGLAREFAWQGTRDISAWLTVPSALAFMEEFGWDRIYQHNHAMAVFVQRLLCDAWDVRPLSPRDGALLGSMATVPLPGRLAYLDERFAAELQQRLYDQYRIEVPVFRWAGRMFVRPCCQVYNEPGEYDRLVQAIDEMAHVPAA